MMMMMLMMMMNDDDDYDDNNSKYAFVYPIEWFFLCNVIINRLVNTGNYIIDLQF